MKPLGAYMAQVFTGERTFLSPVLRPVERAIYWCCGVDEKQEQHWVTYTVAMLLFSIAGFVTLYALQRLQDVLPFNPQGMCGGRADLVLQHRRQLRHQHELAGLRRRDDDELSHADGRADRAQLRLGGHRHRAGDRADPRLRAALGADRRQFLGRSDALHALRPAAALDRRGAGPGLAGLPQNLGAYTDATTLEGAKQVIAQGPVASQIAIKQLGTNGGGFFNVNSAHPFENPNAITNLIEMWAILVDQRGAHLHVRPMVGNTRQGWAIFAVMGVLFLAGHGHLLLGARGRASPRLRGLAHRPGAERPAGRRQHGRQGGPLRHRQLGDLGHRDDRRLERLGQLHARQLHAARRHRADGQHPARRDHLRRRRLRPLRHAAVRHRSRCSSPG